LNRPDVPLWFWLYDGAKLAKRLRAQYRQRHQEARGELADLYAAVDGDDELRRAQELYIGLAAELARDERLWATLLRTHAKRGDLVALDASVRLLRSARVELAENGEGPEAIAIPPGLSKLIDELRAQLAGAAPSGEP
jgi:hypothetical protein